MGDTLRLCDYPFPELLLNGFGILQWSLLEYSIILVVENDNFLIYHSFYI